MSERARAPKGAGSLYQTRTRAGGTAWVSLRKWTDSEGKRRSVRGQGATPQQALERRLKRESLPEDQRKPKARQKPRESVRASSTVEGYARKWSAARKVSETVRYKDLRTLENHVFPLIGSRVLRTVSGEDLIRMMTTLEDAGLGVGGRRNVYKVMSVLFGYAEKRGKVKTNPVRLIERPKLQRRRQQTVMERRIEVVKLLTDPDTKVMNTRDEARIRVALLGLRPSEALGLRWSDLTMTMAKDEKGHWRKVVESIEVSGQLARHEVTESERGYYRKPKTKTGEIRRVPVDEKTSEALLTWKHEQELQEARLERAQWMEDLIFTRDDGRFINQNDDQEHFQSLIRECQDEQLYEPEVFPIGYLRKISVTIMRDKGVPDSVVSAMMGHTTTVEDQHYYSPQIAAQAEAVKKLAEAL